ncbi:FKBP-type peptidyl-prolyl cis-trans isomerase [Neptunomonas japonica]|uniref:FKBP-type peptidyl-prolyl cis-trans isomerase n=1 Tax=Neptunomonas japonica TaxID=417574 RepID=UPI0004149444|nr:FKBP-type peptidyl-prolyl cis-trans isomerase [Neptunomonas japonica]
MKSLLIPLMLISSLFLSGCGEDPEKEAFRQQLMEKALNDKTSKAGSAFLEENLKREGVHVLPSGVQYKILQKGEGKRPTFQGSVEVHYEGTGVDGVVFDSSYERGKPSVFPLEKVIRGWQEALLQMQQGDIWMLYIPAQFAYGATSPNELIPANSTLIFKVELLGVLERSEMDNE